MSTNRKSTQRQQWRRAWRRYMSIPENRYKYHVTHMKTKGTFSNLTLQEFKDVQSLNCAYCGLSPEENGGYIGIDRKDSSVGYILSNVAPCCTECNFAKKLRTPKEFITHCNRVSAFQRDSSSSSG